jgi:hypothetical protein
MADVKKTKADWNTAILQLNRDIRDAERAKARDQKLHSDNLRELKGKLAEALDAHDKA